MQISCGTVPVYVLNRQTLNEWLHEKTCFCICENKGADQSSVLLSHNLGAFVSVTLEGFIFEPHHEETCFLYMRYQRRRSAARLHS